MINDKLRLAAGAILLVLAGCNPQPERTPGNAGNAVPGASSISCAVSGEEAFSEGCAVERVAHDGALFLTVHHPDGGFRRFEVLRDGNGVAVADGAHEASVHLDGDTLEVAVQKDRYRFPATRTTNGEQP